MRKLFNSFSNNSWKHSGSFKPNCLLDSKKTEIKLIKYIYIQYNTIIFLLNNRFQDSGSHFTQPRCFVIHCICHTFKMTAAILKFSTVYSILNIKCYFSQESFNNAHLCHPFCKQPTFCRWSFGNLGIMKTWIFCHWFCPSHNTSTTTQQHTTQHI